MYYPAALKSAGHITPVSHAKTVTCSLCKMGEAHTQTERRSFCRVNTFVRLLLALNKTARLSDYLLRR